MTAKEQIVERKNQLAEKAKDLASTAESKATEVAHAAGERIESFSGVMRRRTTSAVDRVQRMGSYLRQNDIRAIGNELTEMVREHPIRSLLIGLGSGFLVGRLFAR